jgi:hypothetical protein
MCILQAKVAYLVYTHTGVEVRHVRSSPWVPSTRDPIPYVMRKMDTCVYCMQCTGQHTVVEGQITRYGLVYCRR